MSPSAAHAFQPTSWGAWIAGAAAHPVAGDHFSIRVGVGVGCIAELRSQSPTVARSARRRSSSAGPSSAGSSPAGPSSAGSSQSVFASVGSDGVLVWRPEPGVASDGCFHRSHATIQLASNARLLWRDEFLLDPGEGAGLGTWNSRLRVSRDGWPVVSTEVAVGPASPLWDSPAVLDGARAVSLLVVVDPGQPAEAWTSARAKVGSALGVALPLSGPGVQIMAWGHELSDCRATIEAMVHDCGAGEWVLGRWRSGRSLDAVG